MRILPTILSVLFAGTLLATPQDGGIKGTKRPGPVKVDEFNDRPKTALKRGGTVTQAVNVGFRSLDAEQDNSALTSEVQSLIQEALLGGSVETWDHTPALAERWEVEDNVELKDGTIVRGKVSEGAVDYEVGYIIKNLKGEEVRKLRKDEVKEVRYQTSFTFYLRKGVVFHNGDAFNAKDVEWNYRLLRSPKNGMPNLQGYFEKINECAVIDDYTVRLTYSEQYWMALGVCGGYMKIRPHKAWDPEGLLLKDEAAFFKTFPQHPLIMSPIGTGPYQFDSYKKDFEVVVKRFDKWWGATAKELTAPDNYQGPDKIRYRIIKDVVAQLQALKNGEVDYVQQIPPENFDDFFASEENRKSFAAVEMVYPMYRYLGFNFRKELWKDKRVRWALSYGALDIDKFNKDVMKGRAERVCSPIYAYAPNFNSDLKFVPFDPKKAEELLSEAGWWDSDGDGVLDKDGKKFEFEALTRDTPPTHPLSQILLLAQANLKKLGIKMEIRKLEWTALLDKLDRGDFDLILMGWALASPPNRQDGFQIWHSSQIGESGSNHIAYTNAEVDELLVKIRREMDEPKRILMERRLQQVIYDDQPYIFLMMPAELRAYNKKWRSVRFPVVRPCHVLPEWHLGE